MIPFLDLFNHVNWLLKDIPETGTRGNAFSRLPQDVALFNTNMIVDTLAKENHQRFLREYLLTIDTTPTTGNVDSTGHILTLPDEVFRVIAIKTPDAETFSLVSDFVSTSTIRKYSDRHLYNVEGWTDDDEYIFSAGVLPTRSTYHPATTNPVVAAYWDDIDFPREWFDLLSYSVCNLALLRAQQEPTVAFTTELNKLQRLWKLDSGRITEHTTIKNKRSGIGGL